jgi:8-oxo-dGTP pyrophosphatase MutT (NUDIX family)
MAERALTAPDLGARLTERFGKAREVDAPTSSARFVGFVLRATPAIVAAPKRKNAPVTSRCRGKADWHDPCRLSRMDPIAKESRYPPRSARHGGGKMVDKHQVAALPYKVAGGQVHVLLLTSRETRRPVIPKGWPMKALANRDAAAKEAYEEAGLRGHIGKTAIGFYHYWKRRADHFDLIRVDVYPLHVRKQCRKWPEKGQRISSWLPADDAALLVDEPALGTCIREFAESVRLRKPRSARARRDEASASA